MPKKPKAVRSNARAMALAREIYKVGLNARIKFEGYNQGFGWKHLTPGQLSAWVAVGKYLSRNFERRPGGKLKLCKK